MGYKHTASALQAPGLTTTQRAVLALVAEFANAEHADCMHHRQERIADRLEVSRETVGRALARAEQLGYVTRYKRFHATPEGKRRTIDTVQVHHDVIRAAVEAKVATLQAKWDAPADHAQTTLPGVCDLSSRTHVISRHVVRDEKSQQNREGNQEQEQGKKNPYTRTASPAGFSGVVDNSIRYGRDGYDADGTPWESTVKAAFIEWAHTTTNVQAEAARERVLALIAARNGEDVAEWARDFWSWGEKRANAIALAPSPVDAQYEAGALYARLLNAAAADYLHPVTVLHPPRDHRQAPVAAVDRDAETLAQLDAEAEAAATRGDLLPDFAEFYARQQPAAPLSPQSAPAPIAEDDDAAAELERAAQAQRELAARIAAQEAENRRQQDRARLDARYAAEAAEQQPAREPVTLMDWPELEDVDTVSPKDWAAAAVLFAALPPSPDDFTAPEAVPELEDLTEPTPEDHAEFIRLFLVPDTDHHAQARHHAPTTGTPWNVRKVPA